MSCPWAWDALCLSLFNSLCLWPRLGQHNEVSGVLAGQREMDFTVCGPWPWLRGVRRSSAGLTHIISQIGLKKHVMYAWKFGRIGFRSESSQCRLQHSEDGLLKWRQGHHLALDLCIWGLNRSFALSLEHGPRSGMKIDTDSFKGGLMFSLGQSMNSEYLHFTHVTFNYCGSKSC